MKLPSFQVSWEEKQGKAQEFREEEDSLHVEHEPHLLLRKSRKGPKGGKL